MDSRATAWPGQAFEHDRSRNKACNSKGEDRQEAGALGHIGLFMSSKTSKNFWPEIAGWIKRNVLTPDRGDADIAASRREMG